MRVWINQSSYHSYFFQSPTCNPSGWLIWAALECRSFNEDELRLTHGTFVMKMLRIIVLQIPRACIIGWFVLISASASRFGRSKAIKFLKYPCVRFTRPNGRKAPSPLGKRLKPGSTTYYYSNISCVILPEAMVLYIDGCDWSNRWPGGNGSGFIQGGI